MDFKRFASVGIALLALLTVFSAGSAEAHVFTPVEPPLEPVLGERTDGPYFPYSFRQPGDYMPQDYEGYPIMDPFWLDRALRRRGDGRRAPVPGIAHVYPERGSQFYRSAMNRSAERFGDPRPLQTYSNFRYHFENPFRSIR